MDDLEAPEGGGGDEQGGEDGESEGEEEAGAERGGGHGGKDEGRTSEVQYPTSNIEHPTSNIEVRGPLPCPLPGYREREGAGWLTSRGVV
jgi:hypothetical protein